MTIVIPSGKPKDISIPSGPINHHATPPPLPGPLGPSHPGFDNAEPTVFPPPPDMQQLHAYWRMEYIEAPRYPARMKRPFTDLPALGDDHAAFIVHRARHTYLILNRFPYNPGHLLAVPYREVTDIEDLKPAESADLMAAIIYGKKLLQTAIRPDGFNIGFNLGSAAGSSIPHLHAHIVPRWNGDTNFMPVIGQTRTLPQSLEVMWSRLTAVRPGKSSRTRRATAQK